jgi:hypothetical protein
VNRRKLFSFIGIGAAVAIAPKVSDSSTLRGWRSATMTKKIFDARTDEVIGKIDGITAGEAALVKLRVFSEFNRKAQIKVEDAHEILASVTPQMVEEEKVKFGLTIRSVCQRFGDGERSAITQRATPDDEDE